MRPRLLMLRQPHSHTASLVYRLSLAGVLCGPLHSKAAVENYRKGVEEAQKSGGQVGTASTMH